MAEVLVTKRSLFWILPALLLGLHAALMIDAARRTSVTWDEVVYPAAGYSYWKTGKLWMNTEHGPLSKLLIALPLLPLRLELPLESPAWASRDGYRLGFEFLHHNNRPAQMILFWSRVPCILFSVATGLLLFLWVRSIWGPAGGVISLVSYISTPLFLSRAHLALLEMPMYFFMLLSLCLHAQAARHKTARLWFLCGISLGLALACKVLAVSLVPVYLLLATVKIVERPAAWKEQIKPLLLLFAAAGLTFMGLYGLWENGMPAMKDYFMNTRGFSARVPYYFHGDLLSNAAPYFSWVAFLLKTPLAVLALAFAGGYAAMKSAGRAALYPFAALTASAFGVMLFQQAVSTVQLSPACLGMAGMAGALGPILSNKRRGQAGLIVLLVAALTEIGLSHPYYLSYFNALGGGTSQGYRWLADSDQDWGQSLPRLAEYLQKQNAPGIILSYSGAADPRTYGIRYQDLFSPALITQTYRGEILSAEEKPVYLVIGSKVIQSEAETFAWILSDRKPVAIIDGCFFVFDVTQDRDVFRWMADLYRMTRRPPHEAWALKRLKTLEKTS